MIIRSQDKKEIHNLEKISMIKVVTDSQRYFVEVNSQHTIGTYSTEEKAIKVLDMICKEYKNSNNSTSLGHYGFVENRVFQMPQDSEV